MTLRAAIEPLLLPDSLVEPDDAQRRGFQLEAGAHKDNIVAVAEAYKAAGYMLECLTAIDMEEHRELAYQFNRLDKTPDRHAITVRADDERVPTITGVYRGASWLEREAFDMMGIEFVGAKPMPRLLLPENADFHPLRRDQCIDEELAAQRAKQRAKAQALEAARKKKAAAQAAKAEAAEAEA